MLKRKRKENLNEASKNRKVTKFDYQGWVTSDISPMRLDPVEVFERTIAITEKIIKIVNYLDSDRLFSMMKKGKTLETLKWLEDNVLS